MLIKAGKGCCQQHLVASSPRPPHYLFKHPLEFANPYLEILERLQGVLRHGAVHPTCPVQKCACLPAHATDPDPSHPQMLIQMLIHISQGSMIRLKRCTIWAAVGRILDSLCQQSLSSCCTSSLTSCGSSGRQSYMHAPHSGYGT